MWKGKWTAPRKSRGERPEAREEIFLGGGAQLKIRKKSQSVKSSNRAGLYHPCAQAGTRARASSAKYRRNSIFVGGEMHLIPSPHPTPRSPPPIGWPVLALTPQLGRERGSHPDKAWCVPQLWEPQRTQVVLHCCFSFRGIEKNSTTG